MTHVAWESRFKSARYGAVVNPAQGPWRVLEDKGEISPADLIAGEILHFLRSDSILAAVFEDRFERLPWISPDDAREFPRCSVHLASATNSEQPSSTDVEWLSVYVGTLWGLSAIRPVPEGGATVATVLAHIKRVLRVKRNRHVTVTYNGREVDLAVQGQIGAEGYGPLQDLAGRPFGIVHEIEARYKLHVDINTGQLVNLA